MEERASTRERLGNTVNQPGGPDADTSDCGGLTGSGVPCHGHPTPPVERARLPHPVTQADLGKPVALPRGKAGRKVCRSSCGYRRTDKANASLSWAGEGWRLGPITPRESGPTSVWSFIPRTPDQLVEEAQQRTAQRAGAVSHDLMDWHAIAWRRVHQTVRRLQVRSVQAVQAGRGGKVRALQHVLTHALSGRA